MPPQFSDPNDDVLPLTTALWNVSAADTAFFKSVTGFESDEVFRAHVLDIQEEAYNVYPYPCIRRFDFLRFRTCTHPAYAAVLATAQDPSTIFLDVGCCFGNDIRKLIIDGFPREKIVATDLRREFWDLGYKLFNQRHEDYRVMFLGGDVMDDHFLDLGDTQEAHIYATPLLDLQSLTQLKHRVTAIHATAFFHIFTEEEQTALAHRLASLLSPKKGSIIFGSHVARPLKGMRVEAAGLGAIGAHMFCHSDKSWIELWDGGIFSKGTVEVYAKLDEMPREDQRARTGVINYWLTWSVTRL